MGNQGFSGETRALLSVSHCARKEQRKILLGIGNRYDYNMQSVVVEIIRRYGSYSLSGYVSVVRSSLLGRGR